MRREGFELAVSRPEVIFREIDGEVCEPYEEVTVDVEEQHQGAMMEALGMRGGGAARHAAGRQRSVRLDYIIASRGLIGFRPNSTTTSGTGLIRTTCSTTTGRHSTAVSRRARTGDDFKRHRKVLGYALMSLQERGRMFVGGRRGLRGTDRRYPCA